MAHLQTKRIQLFSSNSLIRKFRVTIEVPIETTWMDVVQHYFLNHIGEEYRHEERMMNELGLSCNSKAIVWTDTIAISMERDKIGVRSDILKVNIRKRLNALALTPRRRNDLNYLQESVDQYNGWGGHNSQTDESENEEQDGHHGSPPMVPPPQANPNQPVAGPSSAMAVVPPQTSSTTITGRVPRFEVIPKQDPMSAMSHQCELLEERAQINLATAQSLLSLTGSLQDVSSSSSPQIGEGQNQGRGGQEMPSPDPNESSAPGAVIVENYRRNLGRLTSEQILKMYDAVQFLNGVFVTD